MKRSATGISALVALGIIVAFSRPAPAAVVTEVYADRAAFEARVGANVSVVDFDDVATSSPSDIQSFAADRYATGKGAVITGKSGQYVSQDWTFPSDFGNPPSPPNSYAPGPPSTAQDAGGHETDVTFVANGSSTTVAGFGCVFIDADYSKIGPSGLTIFDTGDVEIATEGPVIGSNNSKVFRGLVTIDDQTSQPVAAIARVHVENGDEWPPRDVDEGVTLDDFVFGPIVPGSTTTTLPDGGCDTTPTFAAVECLLDELAAAVDAASLGRLKPGLQNTVAKARDKVTRAESFSAGGKTKPAKKQLKKAGKAMRSFVHKLSSLGARKIVPQATRDALQAQAKAVGTRIKDLAGTL